MRKPKYSKPTSTNYTHKVKKSRTAAVFDDKEREQYLGGFFGSKQKRKDAYIKKRDRKEHEMLREQKQKLREVSSEAIFLKKSQNPKHKQHLTEAIQTNRELLKPNAPKPTSDQQVMKTIDNRKVNVTTTFL